MSNLGATERAELADLLQQVGSDRPTLNEGWDTGDLMAHLIVRDRQPVAAMGIWLPPLAAVTERAMARVRTLPWGEQVQMLRSGPPAWNPMGWPGIEGVGNGAEFFVHHEDVRRAASDWQPRDLDAVTAQRIRALVGSPILRMAVRRLSCGVLVELPDGSRLTLRKASPAVVVRGEPQEVLLWAFGRSQVRLDISGEPQALAALKSGRLGL